MQGSKVFRYAKKEMKNVAVKAMRKAGIEVEDITLVIPHQANARIIEPVAEELGVSQEQLVVNIDRYGNTSAASIPIALSEAYEQGRLGDETAILMMAFGAGYSSAGAVVEWRKKIEKAEKQKWYSGITAAMVKLESRLRRRLI